MKYIKLNNEVIIKDENGKYQLEKDIEALNSYLDEYIYPRMKKFNTFEDRLKFLLENSYYSKDIIDKYSIKFIKDTYKAIEDENFMFKSYMSANKFYQNYALKSNDGKEILENYNDKVLIVALALGDGNEELALNLAIKLIGIKISIYFKTFIIYLLL